jgi:hypothetical protein
MAASQILPIVMAPDWQVDGAGGKRNKACYLIGTLKDGAWDDRGEEKPQGEGD